MSDLTYIGLDFETSGVSHTMSAPIQLGIATDDGSLTSLIGGWEWQDFSWITDDPKSPYHGRIYDWSLDAQDVHGIDRLKLEGQPYAPAVDTIMAAFVKASTGEWNKTKIIAVGWNIAAFDFPFLREYFPLTTNRMAYRSVDLNALIFGISESGMVDKRMGEPWTYHVLKNFVKEQAAAAVGGEQQWHDAGYDAQTSLAAFRVLTDQVLGGRYA